MEEAQALSLRTCWGRALSLCQLVPVNSWWRLLSWNILYCLFCYVNAPSHYGRHKHAHMRTHTHTYATSWYNSPVVVVDQW